METYQWGIEITRNHHDSEGRIAGQRTNVEDAPSELHARARYEALTDHLASQTQNVPALWTRISEVKLVRRPVSAWETVA